MKEEDREESSADDSNANRESSSSQDSASIAETPGPLKIRKVPSSANRTREPPTTNHKLSKIAIQTDDKIKKEPAINDLEVNFDPRVTRKSTLKSTNTLQ